MEQLSKQLEPDRSNVVCGTFAPNIQHVIQVANTLPALPIDQTEAHISSIAAEAEDGGRGATEPRQQIVASYLSGIISEAYKVAGSRLNASLEDLVQEGCATLLRAILGYARASERRALAPYLLKAVRRDMHNLVTESSRLLSAGSAGRNSLSRLLKAEKELTESLGREPSDEEIISHLDAGHRTGYTRIDKERLFALRRLDDLRLGSLGVVEIEAEPQGFDLPEQPVNTLAQECQGDRRAKLILIERALLLLTPLQADVIYMKFGIDNSPAYTNEEIGERLGIETSSVMPHYNRGRRQLAEIIPALKAGSFDYVAWQKGSRRSRCVLSFLATAGQEIADDMRLDKLQAQAREYLQTFDLTHKEYTALCLLYGLTGERPQSTPVIAKKLGISASGTSHIERCFWQSVTKRKQEL